MTEDLSKNTLVVLVVLTVIVSLLGTWTVINEANKVRTTAPAQSTVTAAEVSLEIAPAAHAPAPVQATGEVTLTIRTP
jgi:cytochrome oxidase assembly protein ShyY1